MRTKLRTPGTGPPFARTACSSTSFLSNGAEGLTRIGVALELRPDGRRLHPALDHRTAGHSPRAGCAVIDGRTFEAAKGEWSVAFTASVYAMTDNTIHALCLWAAVLALGAAELTQESLW